MLGRLNHVALAVPDVEAAARLYRDRLGAQVSKPKPLPEHGVTIVFVDLENSKIELMQPLGENSPIAGFLARNPDGGIHHVCYEVENIRAARERLKNEGVRILGNGEPKTGMHGRPVIFLHPKDFAGTLNIFRDLVAVSLPGAALRDQEPARNGGGRAGYGGGGAAPAAPFSTGGGHNFARRDYLCRRLSLLWRV
jgi:methylmalonyl-CoA/ethylmalonyl-CoA epimerase